jgi:hypothetical protein
MAGQGKRHFGTIRRRDSGRYQARYRGPDGILRSAPYTFERKSDAAQWLTVKEVEIRHGDWIDPEAAQVPFREYADQWMSDRVSRGVVFVGPKGGRLRRSSFRKIWIVTGPSPRRSAAWSARSGRHPTSQPGAAGRPRAWRVIFRVAHVWPARRCGHEVGNRALMTSCARPTCSGPGQGMRASGRESSRITASDPPIGHAAGTPGAWVEPGSARTRS